MTIARGGRSARSARGHGVIEAARAVVTSVPASINKRRPSSEAMKAMNRMTLADAPLLTTRYKGLT
jgi:hypothetical protein